MAQPPERIKHAHLGPAVNTVAGSTDREYIEYWYVRGDIHERALSERAEAKMALRKLQGEMDALMIKVARKMLGEL